MANGGDRGDVALGERAAPAAGGQAWPRGGDDGPSQGEDRPEAQLCRRRRRRRQQQQQQQQQAAGAEDARGSDSRCVRLGATVFCLGCFAGLLCGKDAGGESGRPSPPKDGVSSSDS